MSQDDAERTTALGLYTFACAYAKSAVILLNAERKFGHSEAPIRFLLSHAAELLLKAFLRSRGVSVSQLRSRAFGHSFEKLVPEAVNRGLTLNAATVNALRMLDDAIQDRYIQTGYRQVLTAEQMLLLCRLLNSEIGPIIYVLEGLKRPWPRF